MEGYLGGNLQPIACSVTQGRDRPICAGLQQQLQRQGGGKIASTSMPAYPAMAGMRGAVLGQLQGPVAVIYSFPCALLRSAGVVKLKACVLGPGAGTPVRSPSSSVDLIKQAGAHDPFASLTGLPRAGTPGSAKPSPTKPSPSLSPNTSSSNLWA
jgi:hypothetical protein